MEVVTASFSIANITVRAGSKLWDLCDVWRDAPRELYALRDDLTRAQLFFGETEAGIRTMQSATQTYQRWIQQSQLEMEGLLSQGAATLKHIEDVVDDLKLFKGVCMDERDPHHVSKRRKFAWLRNAATVAKLRCELGSVTSGICHLLIAQNITISTEICNAIETSRDEIKSHFDECLLESTSRLNEILEPPHRKHSICPWTPCYSGGCYAKWRITWFRALLGSIAVAYSTNSSSRYPKREGIYKKDPGATHSISAVYSFPDWLARATLAMFFSTNLNGNPQLNIRLIHRVDWTMLPYSIFGHIARGDVDMVRTLLEQRQASLYDVMAYKRYISGDPIGEELAQLLPVSQYIDDEDYTLLHKSIAKLIPIDLAELLRRSEYMSCVNNKSTDGLSPLHLAALRGDCVSMRLLLRAGADTESTTTQGETPLHYVCYNGHYDACKLLLDAGAQVNAMSRTNGTSPLACAAMGWKNASRIILLLTQRGANIRATGRSPISPLRMAVYARNVSSVRCLVDNGASINHRDYDGDVILIHGIKVKNHDIVAYLLSQGADLLDVNNCGKGVLHCLATEGDVAMLEMFANIHQKKLVGITTMAKDREGKTPLQLFNERDPTPELCAAFEKLLANVERSNNIGILKKDVEDDIEADEEYYDAREAWGN
ncbi:ankyrin repeat-containing domain protein [Bombardia bombarda]|uniref:Ankyrin repeat-containing domain protein n=1 Tax=Bombardia bombarda TaxID=252184 RepID=A0AA39WGT6_9PEZI|nr:ankyrin repeat-containing domain protein [Bombardia bombarda]